jgi:amino acid efflux transporter
MFAGVVAATAAGARSTARVQLAVAVVLAGLLVTAVGSALPEARTAPLTPFAPNGWLAVGTAASLLVFSFVGWEAVAHLVSDLRSPARDLPRAIGGALAVVTVLYLGLAVATVTVLGAGAGASSVPLADLVERGLGPAAAAVTAVLAVLLTTGAMNAYVAGATRLGGALGLGHRRALVLIAGSGGAGLLALAAGAADVDAVVRASSACFVAVYLLGMAAGARLLRGAQRAAARTALAVVAVLAVFSGPFAAAPVVVAAVVLAAQRPRRARAR